MSSSLKKPNELNKESSEEVCDLLLGFSRSELQEVKDSYLSPKKFTGKVSEVLSSAFVKTVSEDPTIANSLSPLIKDGVNTAIKENPNEFAEILAPIMGPAIRASILNTLNERMESIDSILQQSFSPAGIKWRLESMVSGRKFSDIVLSHTLLYKVEDIFLIYKNDSTLLASASVDPSRLESSDLISAMLSGISDFATDSFGVDENSKFSTFRVGELTVRVFNGADAALAVSYKGNLNSEARIDFEDFVDYLHREYDEPLEKYEGDPSPFVPLTEHLEKMLGEKLKETKKKESKFSPVAIFGVSALILSSIFYSHAWYQKRQLNHYVAALKEQPGIVITKATSSWRKIELEGLKDPLSVDPAAVFEDDDFFGDPLFRLFSPKLKASFAPFVSLDSDLVKKRIEREVVIPPDVSYQILENGKVVLSGKYDLSRLDSLVSKFQSVSGVNKIETAQLVDSVALFSFETKIAQAITGLEQVYISFEPSVVSFDRRSVKKVLVNVQELMKLAKTSEKKLNLSMSYYQGKSELKDSNAFYKKNRISFLENQLFEIGVESSQYTITEVSKLECEECNANNSYIYFSAYLESQID